MSAATLITLPPALESAPLGTQLRHVRQQVGHLRAQAFVDYEPEVAGIRLASLTVGRYHRLVACQSPFVCGGPVEFADVFGAVWLLHPEFSQHATAARRRVFRTLYRALHPRCPSLNLFLRYVSQFPGWRWLRRWTRRTQQERTAAAVAELRRIVEEALHDFPVGTSEEEGAADGKPKPRTVSAESPKVALAAQISGCLARHLHCSLAEIDAMPMKRAVQHMREVIVSHGGGKGLALLHPAEAALWRRHLDRAHAAAPAPAS